MESLFYSFLPGWSCHPPSCLSRHRGDILDSYFPQISWMNLLHCFCLCLLLFFFGVILATSTAYGSSKARDWIGAIATSLHHSHTMPDLSHIGDLHHSSRQCQIVNLLNKARDWTHVLMDTSWVNYYWAIMGTPCLYLRDGFSPRESDDTPLL